MDAGDDLEPLVEISPLYLRYRSVARPCVHMDRYKVLPLKNPDDARACPVPGLSSGGP